MIHQNYYQFTDLESKCIKKKKTSLKKGRSHLTLILILDRVHVIVLLDP